MGFVHSLLAALSLAMFNTAALGQSLPVPTVEYSADRVMETDKGTITGKVFHAAGKERTEMNMAGMQSVMILRPDQKAGYMLMPAQKMYQQMDFAKAREAAGGTPSDVTITQEGRETVEGLETTKYKLVTADKKYGGFMWFTDQGVAVKMDLLSREDGKKSRITMTLKNLQVADQDDALFEVPAGYNKMPSFGGFSMPKTFGR